MENTLPATSDERKAIPLAGGLLDYFPAALAAVAIVSKAGNDKHNPGQEMHHARGKSMDHADCIMRHLVDRGGIDPEDGMRHSAKVAWRALALLQEELEAAGAPLARGARLPEKANASEWTPWIGEANGPPPSVKGRLFEFMRRDGRVGAGCYANDWRHFGRYDDIVAYRVLK